MEVTAVRGGTLLVDSSSQAPRKERSAASDERTIYEEGAGTVDFCSIDGGRVSDELLQQRLQEISRRRDELEHFEIELRAQAIARAELLDMQTRFRSQIKEHTDAASQLKEKLLDREQQMRELEMKLDEKDRELRAIRIDNEAAWAKDDLLRDQNNELATFRQECDNLEAERAQHLKQIIELQEHIQEKESQLLALEEQHSVAQKTILYKDEQLREAQTWITRAQEMDALHSTTNQSLQAEIRERAEQFNQYYFSLQRQYAEMERHHLQTIQRLQLELAEAREQNNTQKDGSNVAREKTVDSSSFAQDKGDQNNVKNGTSNGNLGFLSNGNLDGHPSYVASPNVPVKIENAAGVAVVPSPLLGMGAFLPPGQMTALHPFLMHPQGVPQSLSLSNQPIPQSHVGHLQPMLTIPAHQHWQNQQAAADVSQKPSQTEQNLVRPDAHYSYELPGETKVVHPDHLNTHINQQPRSGPPINGSSEEMLLLGSNGKQYQGSQEPQQTSHANVPFHATISYAHTEQNREIKLLGSNGKQYQGSQEPQQTSYANVPFHATIAYAPTEQNREIKVHDQNTNSATGQSQDQVLSGQQRSSSLVTASAAPTQPINSSNAAECNENVVTLPESATRTTSSMVHGKTTEPMLLDERSLLICIVRAIPTGSDGRIRISTTLPNRLGKMLAPLHWHDYKKRYGKLDEFVLRHPELFVIEGDSIHLREGAQEIISATTAFAKVAAAASSSHYSSSFPSVALTPVAQSNRLRRVPSVDSRPTNMVSHTEGPSDVNVSMKSKNIQESNVITSSEMRPANSALHNSLGNGTNKGLSNGRLVSGGKQQGRSTGAGIISRR